MRFEGTKSYVADNDLKIAVNAAIALERPYFYCRHCHRGRYPLDDVLEVNAGRLQLDVQQAAIDLATEVPYETASSLFGRLSGIAVSSERLHTFTTQVAEGLSVSPFSLMSS